MIKKVVLNIDQSYLNDCVISISGSKSISQRALIIHSLASFSLDIKNLSDSQDTIILKNILQNLNNKIDINVCQGGTTLRFLLPVLSIKNKTFKLKGHDSLLERPLISLIDALKYLGVNFVFFKKNNQLPFELHGGKLVSKLINIDSTQTSQFISALLLTAPYIKGGIRLNIKDKIVSKSYVKMTISIMAKCGVSVFYKDDLIIVKEGFYTKPVSYIESDWSSLAYLYQLVSLSKSAKITVSSFYRDSIQKDSDIVLFFNFLGVSTLFENEKIILKKDINYKLPYYLEWDVLNTPDLMPTYLISCFALGVDLKLTGIDSLVHKESNRIETVRIGLEKFNAKIKIQENSIFLDSSSPVFSEKSIDTFCDHRIALAFSPLVLKTNKLTINNPQVIDKSYPAFWNHLKKMGIKVFFQK